MIAQDGDKSFNGLIVCEGGDFMTTKVTVNVIQETCIWWRWQWSNSERHQRHDVVIVLLIITIRNVVWIDGQTQVPLVWEGIQHPGGVVIVAPDVLYLSFGDMWMEQKAVVIVMGLLFKHPNFARLPRKAVARCWTFMALMCLSCRGSLLCLLLLVVRWPVGKKGLSIFSMLLPTIFDGKGKTR